MSTQQADGHTRKCGVVGATHRKANYHGYLERRRAIVHTLVRAGYDSALLHASDSDDVNDDNVKDKLIVNLVRLLAGTGWVSHIFVFPR